MTLHWLTGEALATALQTLLPEAVVEVGNGMEPPLVAVGMNCVEQPAVGGPGAEGCTGTCRDPSVLEAAALGTASSWQCPAPGSAVCGGQGAGRGTVEVVGRCCSPPPLSLAPGWPCSLVKDTLCPNRGGSRCGDIRPCRCTTAAAAAGTGVRALCSPARPLSEAGRACLGETDRAAPTECLLASALPVVISTWTGVVARRGVGLVLRVLRTTEWPRESCLDTGVAVETWAPQGRGRELPGPVALAHLATAAMRGGAAARPPWPAPMARTLLDRPPPAILPESTAAEGRAGDRAGGACIPLSTG
mmetsp:Transcript_34757/g.99819  ORF Transcript_34757/g.99819 Transcript_34757/m.99819 type:complete len:304 (-) Transcript_34757:80-991(-)